ncbi:hypothetical protein J437_LFUL010953 [Ladona fulva]|uniref:Endonuclease/exonuclease/phosphatase domain-containing protein n=1 Tax=Ladona fulva TaxID=123851 RepID=A0A8K0KFA1_LADFU|nr:hypothetical protein J437_LFUL010953 [Ladona fulva]
MSMVFSSSPESELLVASFHVVKAASKERMKLTLSQNGLSPLLLNHMDKQTLQSSKNALTIHYINEIMTMDFVLWFRGRGDKDRILSSKLRLKTKNFLACKYSDHEFSCEDFRSNKFHRSFKVNIPLSLRDELLDSALWPNNVVVGKFFPPKAPTQSFPNSFLNTPKVHESTSDQSTNGIGSPITESATTEQQLSEFPGTSAGVSSVIEPNLASTRISTRSSNGVNKPKSLRLWFPHRKTSKLPFLMSVYYQNVRGLKTKLDDLRLAISIATYDVIVSTETWLSEDILSSELNCPNYIVFRKDRSNLTSSKSRGGGVLITVKSTLKSQLMINNNNNIEHLFVTIGSGSTKFLIGCVCIPPKSSSEIYESHCQTVENILSTNSFAGVIILGDYNLSNFIWSDEPWNEVNFSNSNIAPQGLQQVNSIKNQNGVLMDLAFSNCYVKCNIITESLLNCDVHHPAEEEFRCKKRGGNQGLARWLQESAEVY